MATIELSKLITDICDQPSVWPAYPMHRTLILIDFLVFGVMSFTFVYETVFILIFIIIVNFALLITFCLYCRSDMTNL